MSKIENINTTIFTVSTTAGTITIPNPSLERVGGTSVVVQYSDAEWSVIGPLVLRRTIPHSLQALIVSLAQLIKQNPKWSTNKYRHSITDITVPHMTIHTPHESASVVFWPDETTKFHLKQNKDDPAERGLKYSKLSIFNTSNERVNASWLLTTLVRILKAPLATAVSVAEASHDVPQREMSAIEGQPDVELLLPVAEASITSVAEASTTSVTEASTTHAETSPSVVFKVDNMHLWKAPKATKATNVDDCVSKDMLDVITPIFANHKVDYAVKSLIASLAILQPMTVVYPYVPKDGKAQTIASPNATIYNTASSSRLNFIFWCDKESLEIGGFKLRNASIWSLGKPFFTGQLLHLLICSARSMSS